MNLKTKILPGIISIGLALGGLGIATPSFAGGNHHHGGGGHHHGGGGHHHGGGGHYYHHHNHDDWAIGLGVGALFGAAIASAASGPHYYHSYDYSCRQSRVENRCHTNQWGDYICHRVRYVRNVC